jgi:hypothetical protein
MVLPLQTFLIRLIASSLVMICDPTAASASGAGATASPALLPPQHPLLTGWNGGQFVHACPLARLLDDLSRGLLLEVACQRLVALLEFDGRHW